MSSVETIDPVELLNCNDMPFGHEIVSLLDEAFFTEAKLNPDAKKAIKAARQNIEHLMASDSIIAQDAVTGINNAFEGNDMFAASEQLDTSRKFGRNVLATLTKATYKDVARFAVWNVERHASLQAALQRDQVVLDERTVEQAERLVDICLFPKHASSLIKKAIGKYGVFHAMDSFEAGAMTAYGYCCESHMSIRNLYLYSEGMEGLPPGMQQTVFHERLHGLAHVGEAGFFRGIYTPHTSRFFEESVVSHAATVAVERRDPEPDMISPRWRKHKAPHDAYWDERILLDAILSSEGADIPVDVLYDAFFSESESNVRQHVETRLTAYMNHLIETDNTTSLKKFEEEYEVAASQHTAPEYVSEIIRRVTRKLLGDFKQEDAEMQYKIFGEDAPIEHWFDALQKNQP